MRPITVLLLFLMQCIVVLHTALAQPLRPTIDNSTPIEITSDRLSVYQNDRYAIFSGKVEALQSTLTLNADEMRVFYRTPSDKAYQQNSIHRIETLGNVLLKTPEESAKGEYGYYDIDSQTLVLEGKVLLQKDQNTLTGNRLIYDVEKGESRLISDDNTAQPTATKERVRAVFTPSIEKDPEPKAPAVAE